MKKSSGWPVPVVAAAAVLGLLVGTARAERRIVWCSPLARVAQFGGNRGIFRGETGCESAVALSPGVVRISNPVVVRT